MTAESLMLCGGVAAFLLTVYWVRVRELRERYAVMWMLVATLALVCGLFPHMIMSFADASHLSYPAAVLFVSLGAVYLFAFTVSVSLSRQHRKNLRLTQQVALLEGRLREVEQAMTAQLRAGTFPASLPDREPRATP
jgi:hypothetical protein